VSGVTNGMPGYTYEIHDQIAQGDVVANRVTWRGVHSCNLAGVPATGSVNRVARDQYVQGEGRAASWNSGPNWTCSVCFGKSALSRHSFPGAQNDDGRRAAVGLPA
jgi:hypothetical protein